MMLLGELEYGVYQDLCTEMTQQDANTYYGFDDEGEPSDDEYELESSEDELEDTNTEPDSSTSSDEDMRSDTSGSSCRSTLYAGDVCVCMCNIHM